MPLILLRGPLASGKTLVALKLAKKLKARYIGVDDLLKENGLDVVDPKEGCIPAKNFIKANEIVFRFDYGTNIDVSGTVDEAVEEILGWL